MFTLSTSGGTHTMQAYDVEPVIAALERGGTILFPTDTIWGVGCDATNEAAIEKVFQLKQRDRSKSFILLVSSISMLKNYVHFIHPRVETLLGYHARPLTVVYERGIRLPPLALAPDGSVAIRICKDPFCNELIEQFGKPVIATSANISNEPMPTHFGEISSAVIVGVDYVVKYRQMDKDMGKASTIARLAADEELVFLR